MFSSFPIFEPFSRNLQAEEILHGHPVCMQVLYPYDSIVLLKYLNASAKGTRHEHKKVSTYLHEIHKAGELMYITYMCIVIHRLYMKLISYTYYVLHRGV